MPSVCDICAESGQVGPSKWDEVASRGAESRVWVPLARWDATLSHFPWGEGDDICAESGPVGPGKWDEVASRGPAERPGQMGQSRVSRHRGSRLGAPDALRREYVPFRSGRDAP